MNTEQFALRIEQIRNKLYKTALLYLNNESQAIDALDTSIYKALRALKKLKQPEYFDTWITRILINECHNEIKRSKRFLPLKEEEEIKQETFDSLPLKEAIRKLPKNLKEIVILRYFSGYTIEETAQALDIPQGTVSTNQRKALELLRIELDEEEHV